MDDDEAVHVNTRDAVLILIIDFALSSILHVVATTLVYIVCMVILFVCSVLYVSAMALYRHEKEIESIKRLFN